MIYAYHHPVRKTKFPDYFRKTMTALHSGINRNLTYPKEILPSLVPDSHHDWQTWCKGEASLQYTKISWTQQCYLAASGLQVEVISPSFWPKTRTVSSMQLLAGTFLSYAWLCQILALHNLLTPYRVSFPII